MEVLTAFKIILIGDVNSGKTSLFYHIIGKSRPTNPTISQDIALKSFKIPNKLGKKIKVEFWDTAGNQRYRSLALNYYRDAVGAFLVLDRQNRQSLINMNIWLQTIEQNCSATNFSLWILGNKSDIPDPFFGFNQIQAMIGPKAYRYISISAKSGQGIQKAMDNLLNELSLRSQGLIIRSFRLSKQSVARRQQEQSCCLYN